MANVDFYKVTCTNKDVLERIKAGAIYEDTIEERGEDTIHFEANARFGLKVIEEASRAYPEEVLQLKLAMDADFYTITYFLTFRNGEDTLENIELGYTWNFRSTSENKYEGMEELPGIQKAFEDFFRGIDKVTINEGKYKIERHEDKEITVTMPIGDNLKARATKRGTDIELETILQKKTVETWEEAQVLPF